MRVLSFLHRAAGRYPRKATVFFLVTLGLALLCVSARADDWPQWLGPQRDGVWRESGIVDKLPDTGPKELWRVPVQAGYCGPAVANGRVYLLDRVAGKMPERKRGERAGPAGVPGNERVLCLEARSGATVWEHTYDCSYRIEYPAGPRATPVVSGNRLFTLGAMGDLRCLEAGGGKLVWSVNFVTNFHTEPPLWGWAAHPLLDGNRLICLVGGTNSVVVAFEAETGKTLWRALSAQEIGYAPPMIYTVAGQRQLIIWHTDALTALSPETGTVLWTQKYPLEGKPHRPGVTIATPRFDRGRLFLSHYYEGAALFELSGSPAAVRLLWNRHGKAGVDFDEGLHTVMSTPVVKDGMIYGICGTGELRCLDATNGDRKWETYAVSGGKEAPLANAFMVAQADRHWIWNDQGELILARLNPAGYEEISRAKVLSPLENTRGRDVLWCHPAYANRCAYVHNGKELVCLSLAADEGGPQLVPAPTPPGASASQGS